ncbi:MAG: AEC family transporter [Wolinella sp.]
MLTPLFSIISFILAGYLAKKTHLIEQKSAPVLIDYIVYFAIPALVFEQIYYLKINTTLFFLVFIMLFSIACSTILVVLLGRFLGFALPTLVTIAMMSGFGNTLFLGAPVIEGFMGEVAMREVIFYDQFITALPVALFGPFILALANKEDASLRKNILAVLRFPPAIAMALALMLKSVEIPEIVFHTLRMFGATVTPMALFAVGLQLVFSSIRSEWRATILVLFGKMILAPLIVFLLVIAFGVKFDASSHVAILQAAMPPMVLASAMVMKAQLNTSLAVATVAFGVGASLVILPTIYSLLLRF